MADHPSIPLPGLIARSWRGWTHAEDADSYFAYLQQTGIAGYAATPGNRGSLILRRLERERAEFLMLSFWDSWQAIEGFAGPARDRAVFFPRDDFYLIARDRHVDHFELLHAELNSLG